MVRSDLVRCLCDEHPHLRQRDIEAVVTAFFDQISARLAAGGRVELRGFGAFSTRARDARVGRNPASGMPVEIAAKRVAHFKPGKDVCARLNS